VRGTVRMDTSRGADTRPVEGKVVPYQRTYVLARAGRLWLIAADQATG